MQSSLSARRAWIEISRRVHHGAHSQVALRKESADRNRALEHCQIGNYVALRKESVDRNWVSGLRLPINSMSLSARRAWIEIKGGQGGVAEYGSRSPQGERG